VPPTSSIPRATQQALRTLIRAVLVIIDNIGMVPVSPGAAEALFRIVDAAYERRSLAIASNPHPSGFDDLMPQTLAAGWKGPSGGEPMAVTIDMNGCEYRLNLAEESSPATATVDVVNCNAGTLGEANRARGGLPPRALFSALFQLESR